MSLAVGAHNEYYVCTNDAACAIRLPNFDCIVCYEFGFYYILSSVRNFRYKQNGVVGWMRRNVCRTLFLMLKQHFKGNLASDSTCVDKTEFASELLFKPNHVSR